MFVFVPYIHPILPFLLSYIRNQTPSTFAFEQSILYYSPNEYAVTEVLLAGSIEGVESIFKVGH